MKKKKIFKRNGNGVDKLTVKEELFKNEYLMNGFNATRAYMKISDVTCPNQAGVYGYEMLRKGNVIKAIDDVLTKMFSKMEVSAEMLIAGYINQAFYDERSYYDENDVFIGMKNLNIVQQACIESIETEAMYAGSGADRVKIGEKQKVKFYSRQRAMDTLMKHKGLLRDIINNNTIIFGDKTNVTISAAKELREKLGDSRITELKELIS
jgi:phage terminase small subunit